MYISLPFMIQMGEYVSTQTLVIHQRVGLRCRGGFVGIEHCPSNLVFAGSIPVRGRFGV